MASDSRTGIRAASKPRPVTEQTLFRSDTGAKSLDALRDSNNSVTTCRRFNIYVGYIRRARLRPAPADPCAMIERRPCDSAGSRNIQICW